LQSQLNCIGDNSPQQALHYR